MPPKNAKVLKSSNATKKDAKNKGKLPIDGTVSKQAKTKVSSMYIHLVCIFLITHLLILGTEFIFHKDLSFSMYSNNK